AALLLVLVRRGRRRSLVASRHIVLHAIGILLTRILLSIRLIITVAHVGSCGRGYIGGGHGLFIGNRASAGADPHRGFARRAAQTGNVVVGKDLGTVFGHLLP